MNAALTDYASNKSWYLYIPLWCFYFYIFIKILGYQPNTIQPLVVAAPATLNFIAHEFAHILASFFGEFIAVLAGSIVEISIGLGLLIFALNSRSYFSSIFCALWLMLSLRSVGLYMADANRQAIELTSFGASLNGSSTIIHDWNYIFSKLHLLDQAELIGKSTQFLGLFIGIVWLGFGVYLIILMFLSKLKAAKNS